MIHSSFVWMMDAVHQWGYLGIILLMALESSVVPIPSELVIPPAAYWASQGEMSFPMVILAGTFGSWLGSAMSYWVSHWLGRPIILRYGKYVFIGPDKLVTAEGWVHDFGAGGVFFARVLPVLRHLVSIPAGICRMNFKLFSLATCLGAGVWCAVLAFFGAKIITAPMLQNAELMVSELKHNTHWIVALALLFALLYVVMVVISRKHRGAFTTPAQG
jgi:membrane protein DedA with SNARE-associated domain